MVLWILSGMNPITSASILHIFANLSNMNRRIMFLSNGHSLGSYETSTSFFFLSNSGIILISSCKLRRHYNFDGCMDRGCFIHWKSLGGIWLLHVSVISLGNSTKEYEKKKKSLVLKVEIVDLLSPCGCTSPWSLLIWNFEFIVRMTLKTKQVREIGFGSHGYCFLNILNCVTETRFFFFKSWLFHETADLKWWRLRLLDCYVQCLLVTPLCSFRFRLHMW